MFRQIIGQDHAIGLLQKAIENDRIAQAYLFHGGDGVGKFVSALYFGMAVNCYSAGEFRPCGVCVSCRKFLSFEHKDFIYIFPTPNMKIGLSGEFKEGASAKEYEAYMHNKINTPWKDYYFSSATEIRKESIMMLQHRMELSIHEANYRICIVEGAEHMNNSTTNAFLKTLEEPPQRTIIILITEKVSALLPTVVSRCQSVYFKPLSRPQVMQILSEKFDFDSHNAKIAAMLAGGNLKTAIRIAEESNSQARQIAFRILELAISKQELVFYNEFVKVREGFPVALIHEVFNYIAVVISDLLMARENAEYVINIDFVQSLQENLKHNPELERCVHETLILIEDYKRKLDGHVNSTLVLINLFQHILKSFS